MMSLGATGVISVASNIVPAEISRLTNACRLGDFGTAAALHHELFQLMNAMFIENNPTAVKTAAAIMGLCTEELRLPLTAMSATNRERVANAIAAFIPVTA
jgi:4-hydroxy-tetrahydrodipicolinate synthase